eukprot:6179426-Pleurochrysis_carterae.AAC.1
MLSDSEVWSRCVIAQAVPTSAVMHHTFAPCPLVGSMFAPSMVGALVYSVQAAVGRRHACAAAALI